MSPVAFLTPQGWVLMGGKGNGSCVNTNLLLSERIIYHQRWSNFGPWEVMEQSIRTVFH